MLLIKVILSITRYHFDKNKSIKKNQIKEYAKTWIFVFSRKLYKKKKIPSIVFFSRVDIFHELIMK